MTFGSTPRRSISRHGSIRRGSTRSEEPGAEFRGAFASEPPGRAPDRARAAALRAVAADLVRGPDGWRSANLSGRLPEGGEFALTLTPAGEQQMLRLTSTDAGDLLHTLHQTSRIEGGQLALDATIFRQQPSLQAEGKLVARQFHVLDAPLLARLLTVASLDGHRQSAGRRGHRVRAARCAVRRCAMTCCSSTKAGCTAHSLASPSRDGSTWPPIRMDLDGTIVPALRRQLDHRADPDHRPAAQGQRRRGRVCRHLQHARTGRRARRSASTRSQRSRRASCASCSAACGKARSSRPRCCPHTTTERPARLRAADPIVLRPSVTAPALIGPTTCAMP